MNRVESIILPRRRPSLFALIAGMVELSRQRRALARLDADQLADIGVSAEMAAAEAERSAWDAPQHWRA